MHYFYFSDPVKQAMFEKMMIEKKYELSASYKSDYPSDKPYATLLDYDDGELSVADRLVSHSTLNSLAEPYDGLYDGWETKLDADEVKEVEEFLESLMGKHDFHVA